MYHRTVVVVIIMTHKCDSKCKGKVKVKCCKCGTVCHLQCFGFKAGEKIDGQDTILLSSNGSIFTTFVSCMAFKCCSDEMEPTEQKFVLKMPTTSRSTSKTRTTKPIESEQLLANELNGIKEMLASIKGATDANTAAIAEIKSLSTKNEASMNKMKERIATPSQSPAMNYVQHFRQRAHSKAEQMETPGKRKRIENASSDKLQLPQPRVGTKSNVNGLTVVPKRVSTREEPPKFEKAIWVSRLGTDVTEENVMDYIIANTTVTDKSMMNVHKLIKKGTDVSSLNFVSFKVELNAADFDVLNDPAIWPQHVMVREFMQTPKNTLGNHFPPLNPMSNGPTTTPHVEPMDATGS